ncbi:MAG: iron-containing alcohol dehydrogenase [Spirochaetes bacterium]|nr:iron-containing alcohol dehydrogenase [Spirochaetota bacterium]
MHIPDHYEFLNHSKIISGKCALETIPAELGGYDAQKPLVIALKSVVERGLKKKFIKTFSNSMVVLGGIYDEVREYAGISLAQDAAILFKARGCDSIIALGCGPAVDLAKAVNVLVSEKIDNLSAHYEGAAIKGPLKPLIVVTAGRSNGREAANALVVDNRELVSDFLCPDVFIIDPRMTPGSCGESVAESGATAMAQAFAVLTDRGINPMTAAVAHPAMSYLAEYLAKGVKRPKNRQASVALANASVMASAAYSNSRPGMANLLAGELAEATGISAGRFERIILPSVIAAMLKKKAWIEDDLYLAAAGIDGYAATPAGERTQRGLEVSLNIVGGLKKVLPVSLSEMKVQKHFLEKAAKAAAAKSGKRFTEAECASVLAQAWDAAGKVK